MSLKIFTILAFLVALVCLIGNVIESRNIAGIMKERIAEDSDKLTMCVTNISNSYAYPNLVDDSCGTIPIPIRGLTLYKVPIFHPVDDSNHKISIYSAVTYCLKREMIQAIYNEFRVGYHFPCYRYAETVEICPPLKLDNKHG